MLSAQAVDPKTFRALFSVIAAAPRQRLKNLKEANREMSANKTLIAYQTKSGATEEYARKIADVLRSKFQLEVDLVDLEKQKMINCSLYQNFVIGAGVRAGKVYDKALKCLENKFEGKRVAFFVSSGEAGDPKTYESAKAKFVENTLTRYPNINPVGLNAFGGRMKILGKSIFNNIDLSKAEAWAEELGKKFTQ
jgi:menaquinone-dependent protoporphyrinogen IX oxidase